MIKTFKEIFNDIGQKYVDVGIDNDYNLLAVLLKLSEEFFDEKNIQKEIQNLLETKKEEIEKKQFEIKL